MKRAATFAGVAVAFAFLALTTSAFASPLGPLNVANCGGGGVTVTATTIVWSPAGTVAGTGCIITGIGTNVVTSFGTLGAGVNGNIMNLTAGGGIVNNFMTFPAVSPTFDFVLTSLPPAISTNGTNCASVTAGQSCVAFAGSPFLLTLNSDGSTSVSLGALGTIADANGTSAWSGAFTTQFASTTPFQIQTTINGGGSEASTQSGSFVVTAIRTPEPASMMLLGSGLAALAFNFRRRVWK